MFAKKIRKACTYKRSLLESGGGPSSSHFGEKESEIYNGPENSLRSHTQSQAQFYGSCFCVLFTPWCA